MKFYPVIMCGGGGTRLWPLSRPSRPKQFIALVGDRSPFQSTLTRLACLEDAATTLVVAGVGHADWIQKEAAQVGIVVDSLLEPQARESAAAIAAAAAWVAQSDPSGVLVIVASDHHIPDEQAFAAAVTAAGEAAAAGWIVTLGVDPTAPATAYGYIRPGEQLPGVGAVRRNEAFVEKPDLKTAQGYLEAGYLWNSGNFIGRADTLLRELDQYEPGVAAAAARAVSGAERSGRGVRLGPDFLGAPKISFDYAVMERTDRAAVLPVDFEWSDLGAWDAVWAASERDARGNSAPPDVILQDSHDCLVRVSGESQVALVGVRNLAVIGDAQSLLICDLAASQKVKGVADLAALRAKAASAPRLDLASWSSQFDAWFRAAALPVWWTLGGDHHQGGFHELLGLDGRPSDAPKRARVQARQAFVFARAASMGLPGPWLVAAEHGWRFFEARYQRPDGLFRTLVSADGAALDETPYLYDQAFALLALAALHDAGSELGDCRAKAEQVFAAITAAFAHSAGGFRESGQRAFQANATMHLLEAALAWIEADGGGVWSELAEDLVDLALSRFMDPDLGMVREFFEADWSPAEGAAGEVLEPGHQFEWAWLLDRWSRMGGTSAASAAAQRLYRGGMAGWDVRRQVAVDELKPDLSLSRPTARLWPQTEMVKAAIHLARAGAPGASGYRRDAEDAAAGLWRYLDTPVNGLWRDKMTEAGAFVDEPAPASTFYHLFGAVQALQSVQADVTATAPLEPSGSRWADPTRSKRLSIKT